MLDLFRKRGVSSVVYSVLMGAIVLVFIIQFRPNSGSSIGSLRRVCVAKVRGTCIEERDWKAQRYLLRGRAEAGVNYNKAAVDSLVERTLLEQEGDRLGIRVTDDEVMNDLVRGKVHVTVPASIRDKARQLDIGPTGVRLTSFATKDKPFDQAKFEQVVSNTTGMNTTEFADAQYDELRAMRVLDLVGERVRVSDAEAWDEFKDDKTTATIRYVRFSPAYFSERFVTIDEASITAWLAAHDKEANAALEMYGKDPKHDKDKTPHLFHPRHILIDSKKDDADDKKKKAAKDKADAILAKVLAGEDFATLAKENSEDPGSKDNGGEYDWSDGSSYVPEFRDGLSSLKVGETKIVQTEYGFHILQLLGRFDGKVALAEPMYAKDRGQALAGQTADDVAKRLVGKIPVAIDDALKAKIEDAKKSGKTEEEATAQVTGDEARARITKAIDEALTAIAPPESKTEKKAHEKKGDKKDGDKPALDAPPPQPRWKTDERAPRVEESGAFNAQGSPVIGLMDQEPIVSVAMKLTKEVPLSPIVHASGDLFLIDLAEHHEATREEFQKERPHYLDAMIAKKREDAVVNYLNGLRDAAGKDLTVDARYVADDKKSAGSDQQPEDDGE